MVVLKRNLSFGILREVKKLILKLIIDRNRQIVPKPKLHLRMVRRDGLVLVLKNFPLQISFSTLSLSTKILTVMPP